MKNASGTGFYAHTHGSSYGERILSEWMTAHNLLEQVPFIRRIGKKVALHGHAAVWEERRFNYVTGKPGRQSSVKIP